MTDTKAKHTYVLQRSSWIGPHLKAEGDEVEMTETEAKYYVPHILVKKAEAQAATAPAAPKATKEKR